MSRMITFHPMARQEMNAAAIYYESKTRHTGWNFYEAIECQLQKIADHPLSYPRTIRNMHRAPIPRFPYHIIFELDDDNKIHIIAVAHQKRKPGYWIKRL